jgi:o-succinylbenzoate synthase
MILDSIKISPYELTFNKKYSNSKFSIFSRQGWIISISSSGMCGYGDCCPLDQFSEESYEQSGYGLEGFKLSIDKVEEIDFEELMHLAEAHGESQPSVQFAIESAIHDLCSKLEGIPLNRFLNKDSKTSVKINYYQESQVEPFKNMIIKLKMMGDNLFKDIETVDRVLDQFQGMAKLRLDFNGSMDLTKAIRFCKMLEGKSIDYIEQPLSKNNFEDMYELTLHTDIPIAADEMLTDLDSLNKVLDYQCADVFILKPMLIGGIMRCREIIKIINLESKRYNISSLLESNIGRLSYLHLASACNLLEESGIATNIFFNNDICDFPEPINGIIKISNNSGAGINEINL